MFLFFTSKMWTRSDDGLGHVLNKGRIKLIGVECQRFHCNLKKAYNLRLTLNFVAFQTTGPTELFDRGVV